MVAMTFPCQHAKDEDILKKLRNQKLALFKEEEIPSFAPMMQGLNTCNAIRVAKYKRRCPTSKIFSDVDDRIPRTLYNEVCDKNCDRRCCPIVYWVHVLKRVKRSGGNAQDYEVWSLQQEPIVLGYARP